MENAPRLHNRGCRSAADLWPPQPLAGDRGGGALPGGLAVAVRMRLVASLGSRPAAAIIPRRVGPEQFRSIRLQSADASRPLLVR